MRFQWLTSQLSVTFTDYHTLPVSVSYRDLTRRTAPYKLFPRTDCVELFCSAYKPSIVLAALLPVAWKGCLRSVSAQQSGESCVASPCLQQRYPGNERAAVWRHRCCAEKTPPPLTTAQRVFCHELFSGRCLATIRCATPAAHPTAGWHVTIFYTVL
jgi:hypothetical protein